MGYHKKIIEKGEIGNYSKIKEEFEEFTDAVEQNALIMQYIELSDLIGAIEMYVINISKGTVLLEDLITMKNLTQSAFKDGSRT